MSEIERAIAYWEEFEREIDEMPHSEILEAQREPVRTALTVLRAELEREKNPLTCDGCVHLPWKYEGSVLCQDCSRGTILPDRFEPKGEPNV